MFYQQVRINLALSLVQSAAAEVQAIKKNYKAMIESFYGCLGVLQFYPGNLTLSFSKTLLEILTLNFVNTLPNINAPFTFVSIAALRPEFKR